MATVELRPGDTLNIVWKSIQDTPLGLKEVESSFAFEYDELLSRLQTKGKKGKSKKSGTQGALFSRIVALAANALKKGKWSTGADIDKDQVFGRMIKKFHQLDESEYIHITGNARTAIQNIYENRDLLSESQAEDIKEVVEAIGLKV